ncbi:proline-rich protein 5-like [Clytia hemisphaerica]|uniref:Uncharacterized protein n=1 Tax=Clytia hemisphaerica TaxID=252671 RepID=A0A7M5X9G6_9CNID
MSTEKKKGTNINPVVKSQKKITGKKDDFSNSKEWKSVVSGCTNIFNGKKLSNHDFVKMFETIRSISSSADVGLANESVSRNYEDAILSRGMIILREDIKEKPGHALLHKLGEVWTNFYQNILPTLQALFCSIPMKVREVTLLAFRDNVLLKLKIEEALNINDHSMPKSIMQMFCVLFQASRDPEERERKNFDELERLMARVINPFLGSKGLLTPPQRGHHHNSQHSHHKKQDKLTPSSSIGSGASTPETEVKSNQHSAVDDNDDFEELLNFRRQNLNRFAGGPQRLSAVDEQKGGISESLASLIADGFELG